MTEGFGKLLYILRTEKMEMSQQQVADLLHIDRSTYGYYELDKTQPSYLRVTGVEPPIGF